jgi:hypothetical protein
MRAANYATQGSFVWREINLHNFSTASRAAMRILYPNCRRERVFKTLVRCSRETGAMMALIRGITPHTAFYLGFASWKITQ